jgi:EAL domain-containing protein (putative c-di-GMP-specific phosphodiesterase class I)
VELIAQRRLTTMFQPIVSVKDPLEVFAYECLLRGQDDQNQLISPQVLFDAARRGKLLFHLDRAARLRHIRSACDRELTTNIFINFNPTAIYEPKFCLQSTVAAIGDSTIHPSRFIFEVVETDELTDPKRLPEILRFYGDAGFRVALDDVGAGFSSLNLLTQLRPDFIKLDMMLMRDIDQDRYKANLVSKLLEVAGELEIETIVEGIETVAEWQWALEHGADYAQGYLFGKPNAEPQLSFCPPVHALATLSGNE